MHEPALEAALRRPLPTWQPETGPCLDDCTTARFVTGDLGPAERAEACRHLSDCNTCLDRIALLVELDRTDSPNDSVGRAQVPYGSPDARRPWTGWRAPVLRALAASVVLALLAGLLIRNGVLPGPGRSNYREIRSAPAQVAVPALRIPADGAAIRRAELGFQWTTVQSAIHYEVELLGSAGDVLWQLRTEATGAVPPESLYLEPGAVFYVWVRAHLADGKTVKSQAVSFRILREN